jgi:hypothetical protein
MISYTSWWYVGTKQPGSIIQTAGFTVMISYTSWWYVGTKQPGSPLWWCHAKNSKQTGSPLWWCHAKNSRVLRHHDIMHFVMGSPLWWCHAKTAGFSVMMISCTSWWKPQTPSNLHVAGDPGFLAVSCTLWWNVGNSRVLRYDISTTNKYTRVWKSLQQTSTTEWCWVIYLKSYNTHNRELSRIVWNLYNQSTTVKDCNQVQRKIDVEKLSEIS